MAGSSKTGDVRPFKMMAVLGLIGMGLLIGGVVIYRRTVSGKRNIKGMPTEMKKTQNICSKYDHSSNWASYILCRLLYKKVMNRILQQGRNMQSFPNGRGEEQRRCRIIGRWQKKLMKTAGQKTVKKNAGKNREDLLNQKTKTMQMKSGNPSGFPGKI